MKTADVEKMEALIKRGSNTFTEEDWDWIQANVVLYTEYITRSGFELIEKFKALKKAAE